MNQNATREQIITALHEGKSNTAIARELRADRVRVRAIRAELDIPVFVRVEQIRTIEEKWATHTRPVDGGHLEWIGERGTATGTPLVSYKEKHYSAAAVAFRIKHDREAVGYAYADCGLKHCVSPDHVDDEPGRARTREQLRYLAGGTERPQRCVHGHDQAEHGRYGPNGVAYCEACKVERKRAERLAVTV